MKLFKRFKHSKKQVAFWVAMFALLVPSAASAEGAIDPQAVISKNLSKIYGILCVKKDDFHDTQLYK